MRFNKLIHAGKKFLLINFSQLTIKGNAKRETGEYVHGYWGYKA